MSIDNKRFLEFSKPFIDGAKKVFETMVFTSLNPSRPTLKDDPVSKGDVSAVMGITGELTRDNVTADFKGMLVLSWPYDSYIKTASAMLMETYTEFSDEIADVGAEISNMIMGNAKKVLNPLGYSINMAIPSTVSGAGHSLKYPAGTVVVLIPMKCAHGEFFMELCYLDS
jgi:chemotaxis protein CheX